MTEMVINKSISETQYPPYGVGTPPWGDYWPMTYTLESCLVDRDLIHISFDYGLAVQFL